MALYRGAFLHDIGKVGFPDSILLKRGKLTPDEWMVMRSHPVSGEEICRHLKSLGQVILITLSVVITSDATAVAIPTAHGER